MICKGDIAVGTLVYFTALDAVHIGVVTSAVKQKNCLLAPLEIVLYLVRKRSAEIGTVARLDLDFHIDKIHIGEYRLAVTLFHLKQLISADRRKVCTFKAWGCRR